MSVFMDKEGSMIARIRILACVGCVFAVVVMAVPAAAQIEDQLSAYTGPNAEGYLEPLALAMGADLNSGLFYSAHIPVSGLHVRLETPIMVAIFSDDARTFSATTEGWFEPTTTVDAPTVVGSGEAYIVENVGAGTAFAFPGGFDLNAFALGVPQIRIGSFKGTEAVIRYFSLDIGDAEIGDLSLYGFGLRHSISQYLVGVPVDLAGGFMYQKFDLGEDLIDATAFSFGVQASKRFPLVFLELEPYAGLSFDTFQMDVSYDDIDDMPIDLSFDASSTAHLTLGLHARAAFVSLYGEYNVASQSGYAFGLGFGF